MSSGRRPTRETPKNWPKDVTYLSRSQYSSRLLPEQLKRLQTVPAEHLKLPEIKLSLTEEARVEIRVIDTPDHPAYGECGLFASANLAPNSFVVLYLGHLHSDIAADTDQSSNYDLSLDREVGISVDATHMGTEARFINDYRGVRVAGPNAEFRDVWIDFGHGQGERGIGVFVLSAGKSGKRKEGIKKGEEIVVSYGKGFWEQRQLDR